MRCDYWDRAECRSCTLLDIPRPRQLHDKAERASVAVGDDTIWEPPFAGTESGFRNKAKMVVGGTSAAPTLGILDHAQHGVDLRECGILQPEIIAALPVFARFITLAGLVPYDVAARRGELKHLLVTASTNGDLMARFVLRSTESLPRIRKHLGTLLDELPGLSVVTANLLPTHVALLEGDDEIPLTDARELIMPIDGIDLRLPPGAFFQTNTEVGTALYRQARDWTAEISSELANPVSEIWDLYCGVGGFALSLAAGGRRVVGVESSSAAIAAARRTAHAHSVEGADFVAADATDWARRQTTSPDLVVVNPPRRGLGPDLADWLESSGVETAIYSSCNPESLRADLARMPSLRPSRSRIFDMFPQTEHLEVMVLLRRRRPQG